MHINFLALTWAVLVSIAFCDTTAESLFAVITDTDSKGGCKSKLPSPLDKFVSESKTLVESGLQALSDAQNPSAKEHDVAVRYLWTYFHATTKDTDKVNLVKSNLQRVENFLGGHPERNTPRLYCNDKWLEKLERSDALWDADRDLIMVMASDGSESPIAIEDFKDYAGYLWEDPDTKLESTGKVPYWSDDLKEYVFDDDYGKKSYCTISTGNLGVTQDQTESGSTLTLCPSSFTNKAASANLGKKPTKGVSIEKVLPRSGTFYHELFHLVLSSKDTPDLTYEWEEQQEFLKTPEEKSELYDKTYDELVRRNPETFLWFSVGYWYFQQTQWSKESNQRWSFHSGAGELVQI